MHAMVEDDEDKGTRVTIRLDSEMDDRIEKERDQGPYKVPKTEVIRVALEEYFDEDSRKCRAA